MLGNIDITSHDELENVRRSIAMMQRGAKALDREDSLRLIEALQERIKAAE